MNLTTDGEIIAYLIARQKKAAHFCGQIIATTNGCGFLAIGVDRGRCHAPTIDEALGQLSAIIGTPAENAERKRSEARRLMAEADAISPPVYGGAAT